MDDAWKILREHVGGCREWVQEKADRCNAPSEYVLWGKLIPAEGLGPRCYDHAAKYIDYRGLCSRSEWALINLRDLANDLDAAASQERATETQEMLRRQWDIRIR